MNNHLSRRSWFLLFLGSTAFSALAFSAEAEISALLGSPGARFEYRIESGDDLPDSIVQTFEILVGPIEEFEDAANQWFQLALDKKNGERVAVWILCNRYPNHSEEESREYIARYILREGENPPLEFRDRFSGKAVLPTSGAWEHLFPQSLNESDKVLFPNVVEFLGHRYTMTGESKVKETFTIPDPQVLELLPNLLLGVPHNTRQKDETRLYDDSDYELIRLNRADYEEMIEAGMTCFRVDPEQVEWIKNRPVFYWGIGGDQVDYPECLYRSNYLGPTLFFDEPAVGTRDHVIRPKLRAEDQYRVDITPQKAFEEFKTYYQHKIEEGASTALISSLKARHDVDVGDMNFHQMNLYTWETMPSTAIHQLSVLRDGPPSAMVFEPPDRFGSMRVLPEMNMTYGCQIPADNPKNLFNIIFGFLRGAARQTDKSWGTSIYGAVDRADTFAFFTHAYDLGATRFFFWDTHQLACVPYGECLSLSRHLSAYAESHPDRDLEKLKQAGQVAILFPEGYNLGHVHMGRGNLWGVGELNLDRVNDAGVSYREVMHNLFTEIEGCLREGTPFDLFWDFPELNLSGYREIVRIREDGRIEVRSKNQSTVLDASRVPNRPAGAPPTLSVDLSSESGVAPLSISATATVTESSSPVYYTLGANKLGVYKNVLVCWELFGPDEEDYQSLLEVRNPPDIERLESGGRVQIEFEIEEPGTYRLRASTADTQGRSTTVYKEITLSSR